MAAPAARLEGVTFTYKPSGFKRTRLPPSLRSIDLSIPRGQVYGLLGPNGAGKTTLIKVLCTLILPDQGSVEVLGHRLPGGERHVRAGLGVALAEYERTFHFRLSGRQNLRFFASFLGMSRAPREARIAAVLERVGLDDVADKMTYEYSTGMKHRLAVARALLSEPELLILDEPTAGLDAQTSRSLGDLIVRLAKQDGTTVVYTTHRLEEAGRLCDRIGILRNGRFVAEETPARLARLAGQTTVLAFTFDRIDEGFAEACRALPGVREAFLSGDGGLRLHVSAVEPTLDDVLRRAHKSGMRVRAVNTVEPSVEDAFLTLTKGVTFHRVR